MAANRQDSTQPTGSVFVSPFYHEAKNEITRPNHFVGCSRYLVEKWLPRLGPLGFSLVLYLRSLGYYNPATGERRDCIQINQADLCTVLGVSLDTLQREMKRNEPLGAFVRVQKSYQRQQAGHLQREDSIYYIAMDDPLVPEDTPLLEAILARKEAEAKEEPGRALIRPAGNNQESDRKPQIAAYGNEADRKPQNAAYGKVDRKPQIAAYGKVDHKPQIAVNLIDILENLDIPKYNNIPAEAASKTVVAFLAEIGVPIHDKLTATISRDVAAVLAQIPDILDIAQRQAQYLPFRRLDKGGTWGGLWRKSIEGDWSPPDAFVEHERQERARSARQATRTEASQIQHTQQAQEMDVAKRMQTAWEDMPAAARTALCHEAVSRLPAVNRHRYRACLEGNRPLPKLLQDVLDVLCDDLLRESLDLPPRQKGTQTAPARFEPPCHQEPKGDAARSSVDG
jgi:hypothetical protein